MGWFGSESFTDARLGTFERSGGVWVTRVALAPLGRVELRLSGDRKAPTPGSLALAHEVPTQYSALRAEIGRALYAHLEPYADAIRAGELAADAFDPTTVRGPEDAWAHVEVTVVDVDTDRAECPIEIQLRAAWDEEHTLGVRIRGGSLVELCGSV